MTATVVGGKRQRLMQGDSGRGRETSVSTKHSREMKVAWEGQRDIARRDQGETEYVWAWWTRQTSWRFHSGSRVSLSGMHYVVGWLKSRVLLAYADEADIQMLQEAETDAGGQR